jgi:predicted nucleic acid-binding protein
MSWVVDTCLVIDVLTGNTPFCGASAELLDALSGDGLTVCPVTYIELAPAFLGDRRRQDEFLAAVGISFSETWTDNDTRAAHQAWMRQVELKRQALVPKRPVADILIGAFASLRTGLLTRNRSDFASVFPDLPIREPECKPKAGKAGTPRGRS